MKLNIFLTIFINLTFIHSRSSTLRFYRKLPKFSSLTLAECYKIQFMGDLEQMEELCEIDLERKGGCENVCQERVKQVFGQNDIFDMWYYHVRKPDCNLLCQGGLSIKCLKELFERRHIFVVFYFFQHFLVLWMI